MCWAWSMRWPARTRGSAPSCCATTGCTKKPLLAVHEHNEREAVDLLATRLLRGERIALVSDAGTPAISDPGARLVQGLRAQGIRCIPIPGASSTVTALSVAGDVDAQGFSFIGFLPAKGEARKAALQQLAGQPRTQVLFEAPHRAAAIGRRTGCVGADAAAHDGARTDEAVRAIAQPACCAMAGAVAAPGCRGRSPRRVRLAAARGAGRGGAGPGRGGRAPARRRCCRCCR